MLMMPMLTKTMTIVPLLVPMHLLHNNLPQINLLPINLSLQILLILPQLFNLFHINLPPANPTGPAVPVSNLLQPFPYQPAPQIIHQQMINWCHFKPEFPGRPEEDAEVHLLRTNDWMRTHNFEEDMKVQRFV